MNVCFKGFFSFQIHSSPRVVRLLYLGERTHDCKACLGQYHTEQTFPSIRHLLSRRQSQNGRFTIIVSLGAKLYSYAGCKHHAGFLTTRPIDAEEKERKENLSAAATAMAIPFIHVLCH